jgi:NADH-quinone oxidoreductase subunit E
MQRYDLRHLNDDFYDRMGELMESGLVAGEVGIFLFEVGDVSKVRDLLAMFQEKDWLEPDKLQYWYGRLGQYQEQHGQARLAMQTYKRALADGMPEKSTEAQPIHLYLGNLLAADGLQDEAMDYYRKAMAGTDAVIKLLAQANLAQAGVEAAMADVESMLQ